MQSTGALEPKMPPKSRNSTLVAFEAEASRYIDPDSVAPSEGMSTLVVGGSATVIVTPELNVVPPAPKASDNKE